MAQKQPIPSGFDYKFVDPIEEEYICIICQSVLRSPVQTKCGHKFCKDCLMFAHKKSGKQECPIDREQLTEKQIFSDKATERKILSFKVHCPNQGCTWQGELRDIQSKPVKPGQAVSQNHLDTCPMRVIPCSYKQFGCDFEGPRKSHSEHVITYHLAFTMENMFSLQEENKKLNLQMETMAKDFEAKTNSVKENVFSLQQENKKLKLRLETMAAKTNSVKDQTNNLKKQFLAIQQDLNNTNKKQKSDTINLQDNLEVTTKKLSVMSDVLDSNTNAIDENKHIVTEELGRLEDELDDIKEKCKNTEQHVGGLGKNMGEMRKNISSITDQLSSLDHQLDEFSGETNQNMATKSMIYGLEREYSKLDTKCAKLNKNALRKYAQITFVMVIILVMVVAVVTVMVVAIWWINRSQLNHTEDIESHLRNQAQYLTEEVKPALEDLRDQKQYLTGEVKPDLENLRDQNNFLYKLETKVQSLTRKAWFF